MVTRTTVLLALYTLVLRTDGTLRWGTVIPYRTGSVVYDKLGTSFALENVQSLHQHSGFFNTPFPLNGSVSSHHNPHTISGDVPEEAPTVVDNKGGIPRRVQRHAICNVAAKHLGYKADYTGNATDGFAQRLLDRWKRRNEIFPKPFSYSQDELLPIGTPDEQTKSMFQVLSAKHQRLATHNVADVNVGLSQRPWYPWIPLDDSSPTLCSNILCDQFATYEARRDTSFLYQEQTQLGVELASRGTAIVQFTENGKHALSNVYFNMQSPPKAPQFRKFHFFSGIPRDVHPLATIIWEDLLRHKRKHHPYVSNKNIKTMWSGLTDAVWSAIHAPPKFIKWAFAKSPMIAAMILYMVVDAITYLYIFVWSIPIVMRLVHNILTMNNAIMRALAWACYVQFIFSFIPTCEAAGGDIHQPKEWNVLQGLKMWDGIPHRDFRRIWWLQLVVALGAIVQGGSTLLQTARAEDEGRGAAPVAPVVPALPADIFDIRTHDANTSHRIAMERHDKQVADHQLRVVRLAACILNYISTTSTIYLKMSTAPFQNAGVAIYNFLYEHGHLEMDENARQRLLNAWEEATMAKVGIAFTDKAIFEWMEWCEHHAKPLNKGLQQVRKKFLHGFPEAFEYAITSERLRGDNGSFIIAPNFPAHHPQAGHADPNAGRPDLDAIVKAFSPEWARKIALNEIKRVPRGFAHEVEDASSGDDATESAHAVQKSKVDKSFVCTACGGRGHASNVDGVECLTKQLGIKIPPEELRSTTYPNNIKFPSFGSKVAPRRRGPPPPRPTRRTMPGSSKKQAAKEVEEIIQEAAKQVAAKQAEAALEVQDCDSQDDDESDAIVQASCVQYSNIGSSGGYYSYDDRSE